MQSPSYREVFELVNGKECEHDEEIRIRTYPTLRRAVIQCRTCGKQTDFLKSKRYVKYYGDRTPKFDEAAFEKWQDEMQRKRDAAYEEYLSLRLDYLEHRREVYHDYLSSPEWKAIRDKRMQIDGDKCQRCFNKADSVHHLTYERIFNENIDDLISLCEPCHYLEHGR